MAALCGSRENAIRRVRVTVRNTEVNNQGRIIDVPSPSQSDATSTDSATRKRPGPAAVSVAERFWPKVRKTESCWLWTGSRGNTYGHGSISVRKADGKYYPAYAHRVAWELVNGPIPAGQSVLHSCDIPLCVNPAHLFLGTAADNMRDAAAKNRLSVPKPNHPRRKLTDSQVIEIRRLREDGWLLMALAERFGVTKVAISQIVNGQRRVLHTISFRKAG